MPSLFTLDECGQLVSMGYLYEKLFTCNKNKMTIQASFVLHSNEVSFVGTGEILKMVALILLLMLLCGYNASDHMRE